LEPTGDDLAFVWFNERNDLRSRFSPAVLAVSMLILGACGDDAASSTTTTTVIEDTTSSLATTTTTMETTTSTTAATTTSAPATTTTSSSELPGEPIDFGPAAGDTLAVIGVAHDDVLNLRVAPGADQDIVEGIPPTYDALTAVGQTRQLPGSFWIAVDYQGTEGWVNLRYVGYLGDTTDATQTVIGDLGEVPGAETMLELGFIVAESFASEEPVSEIVLVVAPTVGDLGEITYDVIGLGDDAMRGVRVHVFGEPIVEAFTLDTVEVTTLCGRGVDAGACV
jgi:galactitol-specific phosphotransferase system IIB component